MPWDEPSIAITTPLPERGESPCARLVQLSDPHLLHKAGSHHRSIDTTESFRQTVRHAQSFIHDADAVLLTGDIAQDEKAATYERLRSLWVDQWVGTTTPVWCLPGNHDAPVLMADELRDEPFSLLGYHRLANWEVVLLDSSQPGSAAGWLGEDELARLSLRLAHSTAEHVMIVLHHHPLKVGSAWLDTVALHDADAFNTLIAASDKIRTVVFGHVHQCYDKTHRSVRYLSCPSTGVQFAPGARDFELDTRPPGFRWFALYANGAVRTDVAWLEVTTEKLPQ